MKKIRIPKINSIHYGGKWIAAGLILGVAIPVLIYLLFHVFLWIFSVLGGILLLAFTILFIVEMHQDNSKIPYYERHLKEDIPFDPETQRAVIRCSICTGEKVAGFKNLTDGHFTEVMLIDDVQDEKRFQKIYGLEKVTKEY